MYQPYSSDELTELQRLQQMYNPLPAADMGGIAPPPPTPQPELTPSPMAAPLPPPPAAPPAPPSIDLTPPQAPPAQRGMATSKVSTEGLSQPWLQQLAKQHQDLLGEQLGNIENNRQTEQGIHERAIGQANAAGIEAANQAVYKQRELEASQRKQAELRKAQDEWSMKKDDPSQAFGGDKWAAVLTAIGIGAGTFSQTMGWQNGNPVKDTMNRAVDMTIAAQREQKNSRLNVLAARLGDEKAAELQVRGELHDAIATKTQAQMQGTLHQDALDRLGPIAQEQALKAKEAQQAAFEKLAPKTTVEQTPVKPKGGDDALKREKEIGELNLLWEKQGYTPEERSEKLHKLGMRAPTGLSAAEQTNAEQAAAVAAKERAAQDKFEQLSPDEKKDVRTRLDGIAGAVNTVKAIGEAGGGYKRGENGEIVDLPNEGRAPFGNHADFSLAGQGVADAAHSLPFHIGGLVEQATSVARTKEANDIRRLREDLAAANAKRNYARTTQNELDLERGKIPLTTKTDFLSSMNHTERETKDAIRNMRAQYGAGFIDPQLRARGIDPAQFQDAPEVETPSPETKAAVESDLERAYRKLKEREHAPSY